MAELREVLWCCVSGMTKSGTSIVVNLLNEIPALAAWHELGILMYDEGEFHRMGPNERTCLTGGLSPEGTWDGWGVGSGGLGKLCSATTYHEFYQRLLQESAFARRKKATGVVDKRPAYIYERLPRILDIVEGVPFIVTKKDPRNQILSYLRRYNRPNCLSDYMARYSQDFGSALVLYWEDLVTKKMETIRSIFNYVGQPYGEEHLRAACALVRGGVHGARQRLDVSFLGYPDMRAFCDQPLLRGHQVDIPEGIESHFWSG